VEPLTVRRPMQLLTPTPGPGAPAQPRAVPMLWAVIVVARGSVRE
jgi:hypothetical protein